MDPADTQMGEWVTGAEGCRILGVCRETLVRIANDGRIGVREIPGVSRRRYSRQDLERVVKSSVRPASRPVEVVAN